MNKDAEGHRKVGMSNSNRKSGLNCISRVSAGSEFTALQRLGQAEVIAPMQVDVLVHQWGKMLNVLVPEHVALGA